MIISMSVLQTILPEFIIAGIIAILFYSELETPQPKKSSLLSFIIGNTAQNTVSLQEPVSMAGKISRFMTDRASTGKFAAARSSPFRSSNGSLMSFLRGIQVVLLTVVIWILLSLSLVPAVYLRAIFPIFPFYGIAAYIALSAAIFTAVASTVSLRFVMNKYRRLVLVVAAAIVVFAIFYFPALQWLNMYSTVIRAAIIGGSIALVSGGAYFLAAIPKRRSLMKLSVIGTYGGYLLIVMLLAWNLVGNILS